MSFRNQAYAPAYLATAAVLAVVLVAPLFTASETAYSGQLFEPFREQVAVDTPPPSAVTTAYYRLSASGV